MDTRNYQIVFLGPQGSGKGTQAEKLAVILNLPVIATGDMYRREAAKLTILGEKISWYMHQGKLVPDDITNALITKRLGQPDCRRGFILDGYPRTIAQAQALAEVTKLTHVMLIDISDAAALVRIAGRVMCQCGATYHLKFNPPIERGVCDKCGQRLAVRKDDQQELALRQRLKIYHQEIDPIIARYEGAGILHRINGERLIEDVHRDVLALFSQ
ncbi:nucleoside monophosphate kinase [Candidatus Falkowbacteria bacterium]|nr:nucleoside monophosphate kinase [Candidatus Falkowbacteria bacterium]